MAVIPPLRRLATEDFSGQSWADKLVSPLNSFMESVRAMFINGLTVSENMSGTIRTVELDGNFPTKFVWPLADKPRSVLVGDVYKSDGSTFTLSAAVQVQWSFTQNRELSIDAVTGITPSSTTKYKVTLECKTG